MLTRVHQPSRAVASILRRQRPCAGRRKYATATATTPAPSHEQMIPSMVSIARYPASQPPSHKPPEFRKSQLLRQYSSLLRSTPLMLVFQHNNLKSTEWVAIRRELSKALNKVDESRIAAGHTGEGLSDGIKIQIIQTGIFAAALKIVEFYHPEATNREDQDPTHTLSEAAHSAISNSRTAHDMEPLLAGPLAIVTFPNVSPQHLKAALSILSPSAPQFPAPTRKANPGWHDLAVQGGLQKLLMLGARVEGKVFDIDGTHWVGGIDGGLDGLRSQLVGMLQGIGGNLATTLESAGRSLYFTMEGRRTMLEEETGAQSQSGKEGSV